MLSCWQVCGSDLLWYVLQTKIDLWKPTSSSAKTALKYAASTPCSILLKACVIPSELGDQPCVSMRVGSDLAKAFVQVKSFGVGGHVKLPGPSASQPNIYEFGTPYEDMYVQLKQADYNLYMRNGLLAMLHRNMKIKPAPERWQDNRQGCLCDLLCL